MAVSSCQGCGEETASRLCCPKCSSFGRISFFCSQECFVSSWPSHSKLHAIISQGSLAADPISGLDTSIGESLTEINYNKVAATSPATAATSLATNDTQGDKNHVFHNVYISHTSSTATIRNPLLQAPHKMSCANLETQLPVVSCRIPSTINVAVHRGGASSADSLSTRSSSAPPLSPPVTPKQKSCHAPVTTYGNFLGAFTRFIFSQSGKGGSDLCDRQSNQPGERVADRQGGLLMSVPVTARTSRFSLNSSKALLNRAASARASGFSGCVCRCLSLFIICTFVTVCMWTMRRALFDATHFSPYDGEQIVENSRGAAAAGETRDIVSAVLAQLGGRPFGEEISALQGSVQDMRNELAVVSSLVQHHASILEQIVEKPSLSGRRQGGSPGGALNHAISAFQEGPPLPESPQLKIALLPSAASADGVNDLVGAIRHTLSGAAADGRGVLSQKFYGAAVVREAAGNTTVSTKTTVEEVSNENDNVAHETEDLRAVGGVLKKNTLKKTIDETKQEQLFSDAFTLSQQDSGTRVIGSPNTFEATATKIDPTDKQATNEERFGLLGERDGNRMSLQETRQTSTTGERVEAPPLRLDQPKFATEDVNAQSIPENRFPRHFVGLSDGNSIGAKWGKREEKP